MLLLTLTLIFYIFQIYKLNNEIKKLQKTTTSNVTQKSKPDAAETTTNQEDKVLLEKTHDNENKQSLIKQIKTLEDEIVCFCQQLASKDEQLSSAKATIQQFRSEYSTQEEVLALREEINKLLQVQVCTKVCYDT